MTTYNKSIDTPLKGVMMSGVNVAIGATGAVGAIEQLGTNFIKTVVRVSAGLYRFTINQPIPPKRLTIMPTVASQTAAGSNRKAYYVNGTYNATTGVFDVQVTDLVAASPVAADPVSGDSLDVVIWAGRYKTI